MHDVYLSLKIQNKVVGKTTNNGSHFVKTFQTFYAGTNFEDNELEFINLTEILEGENNLKETTIQLHRHFMCASHTLNLIATNDIDAYFINKVQINKNNRSFQTLNKFYRKVI